MISGSAARYQLAALLLLFLLADQLLLPPLPGSSNPAYLIRQP